MEHIYQVAGIDVHKSMLAVVISDAGREGEFQFQKRKFGATAKELRAMHDWFREQGVREAVMESTAQYWKPVWQELEGSCDLFLAQAFSNRAPRGRKAGLRRRRALAAASCGRRADRQFRAQPRTTAMAHHDAQQAPVDAGSRAHSQSGGVAAGGWPDQVVRLCERSAGGQQPAHAARSGQRGNGRGVASGSGIAGPPSNCGMP